MLISPAYAQVPGADLGSLTQLMPLALIFGVFYFIMIRPMQKQKREHAALLASLKRGDKVVTGGGIIGTVIKVFEDRDEVVIEIAKDLRVNVVKSTITGLLAPPEGQGAAQAAAQGTAAQGAAQGTAAQAKAAPANDAAPAADQGQGMAMPSMQAKPAEAPEGEQPPSPPGPAPSTGSWRKN